MNNAKEYYQWIKAWRKQNYTLSLKTFSLKSSKTESNGKEWKGWTWTLGNKCPWSTMMLSDAEQCMAIQHHPSSSRVYSQL